MSEADEAFPRVDTDARRKDQSQTHLEERRYCVVSVMARHIDAPIIVEASLLALLWRALHGSLVSRTSPPAEVAVA